MEYSDENEFVALDHDRLISAVSKLDKTQHISEPTRNEPTNLISEFNLAKSSKKLKVNNVVNVLEKAPNKAKNTRKLKACLDNSRVLQKPLEKPQAQRIKRSIGYENTKKLVGRWDPVVARARTVDLISFPLKKISTKLETTNDFLSKLNSKSSLERELDEVDPPPVVADDDEDEQEYPMSYEEMLEHRHHVSKLRAQQSYQAAKAKRQGKIKSKKYHRILKKEKLKQQLKEFEELQKKDPEEALKKLEALEKARALERHTLRHKNTGKWAKSKLVRAKYDKEVRQQLSEQLQVSKSLTHKTQDIQSSDDDNDDTEIIPDISLSQDPLNPWMTQRSDRSNVDSEFDFGYKKYLKDKMFKRKVNSDSDSEEDIGVDDNNISATLNELKQGITKLSEISETENVHIEENTSSLYNKSLTLNEDSNLNNCEKFVARKKDIISDTPYKVKKEPLNKAVSTSNWNVEIIDKPISKLKKNNSSQEVSAAFDSLENSVADKVKSKIKKLKIHIERLNKSKSSDNTKKRNNDDHKRDNLDYFTFKNKKLKPVIDEELIETDNVFDDNKVMDKPIEKLQNILKDFAGENTENTDANIDPTRFIEVKPKHLVTALSGNSEMDQLDDDEQVVPKVDIEEVFEEDDVVASFRQEKEDEINKNKLQDIDLSLPGWGSWGGKGVKAPKRKRNRFIMKPPIEMPRRDENKGDVIIREFKNDKLASHKVSDVPFPFTSVKDYEASIRAPIGNTFVTEKAHQKLIKPSVVTKAGAIIEPMDEEELLVKRNRVFANKSVIKLLGQKK